MGYTETKILNRDSLNSTIAIIIGTRPGIIKFSPVIRALIKKGFPHLIVHTGQHYSYNMDKAFFEDLRLPEPSYKLDATRNAKLHGAQTAVMLQSLEQIFIKEKPNIVIVGGDANTNLAGALAARKLGIELAHMEAGLRSDDWRMPEEHNRVMIDHISDYLFAPTKQAEENLVKDNVKGEVFVVGNTIVDAIFQNVEIARKNSQILADLHLTRNEYFLFTLHREENVDICDRLLAIIDSLQSVAHAFKYPIIFPMHPRTVKRIEQFKLRRDLEKIKTLRPIAALRYLDFLALLSNCRLVMTDSGGIQEEACIMKVPCVTMRETTERPETVIVGGNVVAGIGSDVLPAVHKMMLVNREWQNPFGDGKAGMRIVDQLMEFI